MTDETRTGPEMLREVAASPAESLEEFLRRNPPVYTREEKLRIIEVERKNRAAFIRGKEDTTHAKEDPPAEPATEDVSDKGL